MWGAEGLQEQSWSEGRGELNAADWRPCTGNHEQQQQRLRELPAGAHPGVSPAGLCAQQDGEDRGAGGEQRRQNRYGCVEESPGAFSLLGSPTRAGSPQVPERISAGYTGNWRW